MVPAPIALLAGICLTVALVGGVLDSMPKRGAMRQVWHTSAWVGVVGGGTYGLGLFDSRILPGPFDWLALSIVIFGSLAVSLGIGLVKGKQHGGIG